MLHIYNPDTQEVEAPLRVHIQDESVLHSKMIYCLNTVRIWGREKKKALKL